MDALDTRQRVQNHARLVRLLQLAYSAERAAAFAYVGHARSVKDSAEKAAIGKIEADEWAHRESVLEIMRTYDVPISRWLEIRFWVIGRLIGLSCHVIGWFMPYYFAGRLESGNVCEYFIMMRYFHDLEIDDHDEVLYEMGTTEKEHEVFFLDGIADRRLLPIFQRMFRWGKHASYNDVDLSDPHEVSMSSRYCQPAAATAKPSRRLRNVLPSDPA